MPRSCVTAMWRSSPLGGKCSIIRRWRSSRPLGSPSKWYALRIICITSRVGPDGRSPMRREMRSRAREIRTDDNDGVGTTALVGREEELQRLTRALDETLAGIGRLVLVSGEPGVG